MSVVPFNNFVQHTIFWDDPDGCRRDRSREAASTFISFEMISEIPKVKVVPVIVVCVVSIQYTCLNIKSELNVGIDW